MDTPCNTNGVCPLHMAASNYGVGEQLCASLHKAGAKLNVADAYGMTPLHYAKTARVAKELCGDGADFELADSAGNTPMQHHRRNGENGDAVLVGGFLEECERPDPISPAAAKADDHEPVRGLRRQEEAG